MGNPYKTHRPSLINRESSPQKVEAKKAAKSRWLKTAYDIGSNFLKGAPGVAATMLTPQVAHGGQPSEAVLQQRQALMQDYYDSLGKTETGNLDEIPLNRSNEPRKTTKGKGRNFRTVEEGAGMTEKGVKEYKKKNPGSKLQTAVTEKNPKGKRAARRKSFCARSKGWTGERGKAARARWNC